jgi:hypothetical protein
VSFHEGGQTKLQSANELLLTESTAINLYKMMVLASMGLHGGMCTANETFSKNFPSSELREMPLNIALGQDQGPMGNPPTKSLH